MFAPPPPHCFGKNFEKLELKACKPTITLGGKSTRLHPHDVFCWLGSFEKLAHPLPPTHSPNHSYASNCSFTFVTVHICKINVRRIDEATEDPILGGGLRLPVAALDLHLKMYSCQRLYAFETNNDTSTS